MRTLGFILLVSGWFIAACDCSMLLKLPACWAFAGGVAMFMGGGKES